MINKNAIIKNSKLRADEFVEKNARMYKMTNWNSIKEGLSQAEIEELIYFLDVRLPRRIILEGRISFRICNINSVVAKMKSFKSLHDRLTLYNYETFGYHNESATLAFISECLMIKGCGKAVRPKRDSFTQNDRDAMDDIWSDVCDIFFNIISAYGRNYFEDFEDRTFEMAAEVCAVGEMQAAA